MSSDLCSMLFKYSLCEIAKDEMTKCSQNVADRNDESDVPNTSVILDGTEVSRVKTIKFLRLTIDENLEISY